MSHASSSVKKPKKLLQKGRWEKVLRSFPPPKKDSINQAIENETTVQDRIEPAQRQSTASLESTLYNFQPLDATKQQIRLLKLHRDTDGPIHCDLVTFALVEAPAYQALSYEWGPPPSTCRVFIDDQAIEIRENLHNCLLELHEEEEGYLWIDQICVNQSDTDERSSQVQLMAQVYTQAVSVIVWLSDSTGEVSDAARRFNSKDTDLPSFDVLISNNYFKRLWIVQEIVLASEVKILCMGRTWISWQRLNAVGLHWFNKNPDVVGGFKFIAVCIVISNSLKKWGKNYTLKEAMNWFSAQICQDPRDKVFGLMGIVEENERVVVDYNKTAHQVISDVVVAWYEICERHNWETRVVNDVWLYPLPGKMGLSYHDELGLRNCLSAISIPRTNPGGIYDWVRAAPIVAVGYQTVEESGGTYDRWWYEDSTGTRSYHDCIP